MPRSSSPLTIGVEEEYQLVDQRTLHLHPCASELLESMEEERRALFRPEMHQCVLEGTTPVCHSLPELWDAMRSNRYYALEKADAVGASLMTCGAHPFSTWETQPITDKPRYAETVDLLQDLARSNLIFGLHVHIGGFGCREVGVLLMNEIRKFLPCLLALSSSSPFWHGRDTGLESYRINLFDRLPRSSIPPRFGSYAELDGFVEQMIRTGCIDDAKRIWWDVRFHPYYQTVEVRICDMALRPAESMALAALLYALAQLILDSAPTEHCHRDWILENKWRALRYGLAHDFIDPASADARPARSVVCTLLEQVEGYLGRCFAFLAPLQDILSRGTGAQRMRVHGPRPDTLLPFLVEEAAIGL
jgi:carboxylate-amine ligase